MKLKDYVELKYGSRLLNEVKVKNEYVNKNE